jgi:PiT family inorganic phosphate transporter
MIGSGLLQGIAHGSNDVANAISPLLVIIGINKEKDNFGYGVGAGGIAIGELCLGYIVMETMGKKLTKIDFAKGFCV